MAELEEERATQLAAVADDVDPKKEAARIRERHTSHAVSTNDGKGVWNSTIHSMGSTHNAVTCPWVSGWVLE